MKKELITSKKVKVKTDYGVGYINHLYISDCYNIMCKVYFPKTKSYMNFSLVDLKKDYSLFFNNGLFIDLK